ncbi:hypothetical protein N7508_010863 [Penicillium antarcticum]|uniref:uncharacterized protein n=1 Tax=Penicillium antarcticum TaxID=416450 RepID=UPI00238B5494|nr:uncharacterized protein N7508_010863 [Penicillium antarcticum]KAJ5296042.1 hypothetical protein N7508_010863 [Penicillium antarcticum]
MNEIGNWELPDSCVHACTPFDARRPIRSITGSLSLHDYRKLLSADPVDHAGGKLKRKTAALHLNRPSALPPSSVSVSSGASTPPPLSPSYSHSVISTWSEEPEIGEAQPVHLQPQSPRVTVVSENGTRVRPNNRKRLNTFREKLQKKAQAQAEAKARAQQSDSMLAHTQAVPTVSHGGASFEILNPRKSLDLARIVSYIEDVDGCSMLDNRDSVFSLEHGLDRVSLSQLTDASLPSFYSTNSLFTSMQPDCSTPKPQTTDIPSSSPGIRDHVRSLSEFPYNPHFSHWSQSVQEEPASHIDLIQDTDADTDNDTNADNDDYQNHCPNPYRDTSPQTITSSSETNPPPLSHTETDSRPVSPSQQTFSEESEIGEPGSPVYANGEWAQVNERDRGIFYELEQDFNTPQETPLATPMSSPPYTPFDSNKPSTMTMSAYPYPKPPPFTYTNHYSTPSTPSYSHPHSPSDADAYSYDPVYLDPHVQSVLAAANAENMGLRSASGSARALEELQRRTGERERGLSPRFEFQRRKSDERKMSFSQRKGFRKFFSWRSGN